MFRQIAAIFFLMVFSMQVFNRNVIMLNYYTNTAAFAKNCENKSKPMMHCNGKCQMMKKIKAEEKKEQKNPERKAENRDDYFSFKSVFAISLNNVIVTRSYPGCLTSFIPDGTHSRIF